MVLRNSQNIFLGSIVCTLSAHDRDSSSVVQYSLFTESDHFKVDSTSGQVSVASHLERLPSQVERLVVAASDGKHRTASTLIIKLIASSAPGEVDGEDKNLIIVLVIAGATAFLVVLLLLAITVVLRRRHCFRTDSGNKNSSKYNSKAKLMGRNLQQKMEQAQVRVSNESHTQHMFHIFNIFLKL